MVKQTVDSERAAWSGSLYEDAIALFTAQSGQADLALQFGGITSSSRVLDVGCGPGVLSEQLCAAGADVVGIDVFDAMVEQARKRCPEASFEVADAEVLPFEDNTFDVAVCCYVTHHFPKPDRAYQELRRVLVPGGCAVTLHPIQAETATFVTIYSALKRVLGEDVVADFPAMEGKLYGVATPEPYVDLLTDAGFANISTEIRVKPCEVSDSHRLLQLATQIGGIDASSAELGPSLLSALDEIAEPYRQAGGNYLFPDKIIVATGTAQ